MNLQVILNNLNSYRDSYGLITQKDEDGGDTAQRTGSLYCLLKLIKSPTDDRNLSLEEGFYTDLRALEYSPGRYRRHPGGVYDAQNKRWFRWYANPNNFTADQSVLLQAGMVLYKRKQDLKNLFSQRMKQFLFHFNLESYDDQEEVRETVPDPVRPIEISLFIRGFNLIWLYPVLLVTDATLVLDLVIRNLSSRGKYDGDVTYMPIMLACNSSMTTPWGLLAKWLYKKTDAAKRMRDYFSEENGRNGIEPLGELHEYVFNNIK